MAERKPAEPLDRPGADDVARYLQEHPDFFQGREHLLETLNVPHGSHTVSLIERQVAVLRERNVGAREQLDTLVEFATRNHEIFEKTVRLILALLDAEDVNSLFQSLEESLAKDFGCTAYGLIVFDAQPRQINHFATCVTLTTAHEYVADIVNADGPTLGVLNDLQQDFLFRHASATVRSALVLPVRSGNTIVAVLALGSGDADYFNPDMGTTFVNFIADALARLLPRYLFLTDTG